MRVNRRATIIATVAAVAAAPFYLEFSWLIGIGLFATIYCVVNLERELQVAPIAFSSLAFLIGCTQLVIAPWVAQYFPHPNPVYAIPLDRFSEYLEYVVPFCLALGLGLLLGKRVVPKPRRGDRPVHVAGLDKTTERSILVLFCATFGLMVASSGLSVPDALSFFVVLVSQVALVCPLLLYFGGRRYWWKLALLPFGWQLLVAITTAGFHVLLLWALAYIMTFWAIRFKGRGFSALLLAGMMFILIFQPIKITFREQGRGGVTEFASVVGDFLADPAEAFSHDYLSNTLLRLNQGWIVNRVMEWVPAFEDYGGMEILSRQLVGVLLPRFIMPDKYVVGGKEYFAQYTGLQLVDTSMGLGYAGEFFAAFGKHEGILAGLAYGLLLGASFEWLNRAARRNPVWWAWGPYLFLVAIKAEDTVGNAINWTVKGLVVVLMIQFAFKRAFIRSNAARGEGKIGAAPGNPSLRSK